jgi:competence protein ComEC
LIERVSLFNSKKETLLALLGVFALFFLSLGLEYYSYKKFTAFDSQLVNAQVVLQYEKTKLTKKGKPRTYQVLKLKSDEGLTFYTTASKNLPYVKGNILELEIWAGNITFYEYLRTFYGFSKILAIKEDDSLKAELSKLIQTQHDEPNLSRIYEALFLAKPLERDLQTTFSTLGVSHLIAISGFHLGVLSAILFFLVKYPYRFLQNRYFPYRSYKRDSFFMIVMLLFAYMLFLDSPPSLIRAFGMLVVGFFLYDRGVKIISMQTLFITLLLLLALIPTLLFSLGFWLSALGVFYIFLFLIHFKHLSYWWQFFLLPMWIYLMMLPYSLGIFGNFSLHHPLSILWTSLFVIFYPLSLLAHFLGFGNLLDFALRFLLELEVNAELVYLEKFWLGVQILLSLASIHKRGIAFVLLLFVSTIFVYFIYDIAEF